jgi:WD40 repeat protein
MQLSDSFPFGLPYEDDRLRRLPRTLGDYELVEEIARGGMGAVYRARQVGLNREVAVKLLLGGQFANRTYIQRFQREATAAASLTHPNIVAIHDVGEHDGQPYFSMDLIKGRSLAELIQENPLPARKAAQLIQTVAQAVAFAHSHRLLHRDLKPSNVLIDELGVPHITDFGLAKRSDDDTDLTLSGQILGSPNYMAPEQADPDLGPTTVASDVYSLGAMLYHLLTGRPPFRADTVAQTLRLVVEGQPMSPGLLHRGLSRDLETICLKCLETAPGLRYASAGELADELGRFLNNRPIRARPLSAGAKLVRWCRRMPALASSLGLVAILLLVVCIGSPIAIVRIHGEREVSEAARARESAFRRLAEAGERQAQQQLYAALLEQADASERTGEIGQRLRALEAVRRAAAISNSVELRREALGALCLPDLNFERELPVGNGSTLQLMDPAFERIALCRGRGPVEIRMASDWRLVATLSPSTNMPAYVGWWSADRRYLAVKRDLTPDGGRADVEVWDTTKPRRIMVFHNVVNHAISFHPSQHRIITAQVDEGLSVWDLEKCNQIARLPFDGTPINLEFAPDGEQFAALKEFNDTFVVSVHDATSGALQNSHTFSYLVSALAWHPDAAWVAIADYGGVVHLMNPKTGEMRDLGPHKAQAVTVAFSPDGDYLFSGGWEGDLICWDMRTMQRALTVGRQSWIIQLRADGRECALLTRSGVQLYGFVRPNPREFSEDLGPRLRQAAFSPNGRWLAASADQYLGVWDLRGAGSGTLIKGVDEARLMFSADGTALFASGPPGECSRWQLKSDANAAATPPKVQPLEISPGATFTSVSIAGELVALTGPGGSGIRGLESVAGTQTDWVRTVDGLNGISPDGHWLGIYQPYTPLLHLYSLPELHQAATLRCRANVGGFVFSPSGDEVAVNTPDGVEFWATNSWTRTRVLTNFTSVLFPPEGSTLWLTHDFRSAGLYDVTTLEPMLLLPTGTLPLALSADGRRLAVSVNVRHLQVWDLEEVRNELRKLGLDWPERLPSGTPPVRN